MNLHTTSRGGSTSSIDDQQLENLYLESIGEETHKRAVIDRCRARDREANQAVRCIVTEIIESREGAITIDIDLARGKRITKALIPGGKA